MLRKACSWVSSPLAVSLLLRACGNRGSAIDNYTQLSKQLAKKGQNQLRSKIFIASSTEERSKHYGDVDSQRVDFKRDAGIKIGDWIKEEAEQTVFEHTFPPNTAMVLANTHRFKDSWKGNNNAPTCMKLYNSFNYTQDVKYETRMLELPTSGDFKLVLLVPNETDVLPAMFSKLCSEGLEAAVGCIRPVFTTTMRLEAPSMSISSNIVREQALFTNSFVATGLHYGNLKIDDDGIDINVLTCLYSTVDSTKTIAQSSHKNQARSKLDPASDGPCFYFALISRDTPIIIGQYYP